MMDFSTWMANGASGAKRPQPAKILKACRFIEENYTEKVSLREVAKMLEMSPSYLSERFREVTHVPFVEYVARMRYEKARQLLGQGEKRISEIAFAAGFQSLSQFNRVFRKFAGKSPSDYRAHR